MSFAKVILPICLGLLLGGSLVFLHISFNGTLQEYMVQKLQEDFYKKYDTSLECRLDEIDWLFLRMHFKDVVIKPVCKNKDSDHSSWSIKADDFVLSMSWWSLLTRLRFRLSGAFDHVIMYEKQASQPDQKTSSQLLLFLLKLFKRKSGSFIEYDWMSMSEGLMFIEQGQDVQIYMPYACNLSCEKAGTRMQFYAQKGKVFYKKQIICKDIAGKFIWDIPMKDVVKGMSLHMNMDMQIPILQNEHNYSLIGSMKQGWGNFSLKNEDDSFVIDPIQIRVDSKKCLFETSIYINSDMYGQLDVHNVIKDLQGALRIDCRGDLYDLLNTIQVEIFVDQVCYKSKKMFDNTKVFIHYAKPGVLSGFINVQDKQFFEFTVDIETDKVRVRCCNTRDFILCADAYWKIREKQCVFDVIYDKQNGWSGSYSILLDNEKLQQYKKILGSIQGKDNCVSMQGSFDDIVYEIEAKLFPLVIIEKLLCTQQGKRLIHFYTDIVNQKLLGDIDFSCIQHVVPEAYKASFSQEGTLRFQGSVKDGVYYSQVSTKQANIRIPRIYNVVQDINAACELDFYNKCITLKDVRAQLHEGEVACSQAKLFFDKSGACRFMHIPCLLHNVLVSWDKGIFMLFSGSMLVSKSQDDPIHIDAQIIVEKSQIKENLFSCEFQETLFGKVLEYNDKAVSKDSPILNIAVFSKDLLHIKTSFLAAHAKLDLLLKGTVKKPELAGVIQLVSGSFYFPYKSLDITDGKLYFLPDQQYDPLIDVVAKGKLKRFGILMQVAGSVFDPIVQFDAAPYLTEEQILSLLLLGIEESSLKESSLNVMAPALLMQKLNDLVFGPALSKTKLQSKYERLLQSLKYFRFTPQFMNQTGRGGLRGVFEVDASDHLHGKVDVNFMQPEDNKFDVDYALTDDITLRGQKDGPSAYGGEVEFRWKFG